LVLIEHRSAIPLAPSSSRGLAGAGRLAAEFNQHRLIQFGNHRAGRDRLLIAVDFASFGYLSTHGELTWGARLAW
jgi:hypothetical protein